MTASRPASVAAVVSAALCAAFFALVAGTAAETGLIWFVGLAIGAYLLVALLVARRNPGRIAWTLAVGQAGAGLLYALFAAALPVLLGGEMDFGVLAGALAFGGVQFFLWLSAADELARAWEHPRPRRLAVGAAALALFVAWLIPLPPAFLPRPQSGEGPVIGDLRTFHSAQVVYSSMNGELYGTPECLAAPVTCLPAYTPGPALLGPAFLQPLRGGYRFTFHPGKPATLEDGRHGSMAWAYVAVPQSPGASGTRSFCIDASAVIRWRDDHRMPAPVAGACPADAAPPVLTTAASPTARPARPRPPRLVRGGEPGPLEFSGWRVGGAPLALHGVPGASPRVRGAPGSLVCPCPARSLHRAARRAGGEGPGPAYRRRARRREECRGPDGEGQCRAGARARTLFCLESGPDAPRPWPRSRPRTGARSTWRAAGRGSDRTWGTSGSTG